MIRETTIGVLKNYRYGLNSSFKKFNDARTTVLTQRTFNSYAEDPAAAAQAFQLRRQRMTVESQYKTCDSAYRKYQSAWSTLDRIVKDVDNELENSVEQAAKRALNDPTGGGRLALAKELNELADTLVQTMNNKYGDNFIFSGADGLTVPFSWGENGELLYRGVPVDASVPELMVLTDAQGDPTDTQLTLPITEDGKYDSTGAAEDHFVVAAKAQLVKPVKADAAEGLLTKIDPAAQPLTRNAVTDEQGNIVKFNEKGEEDAAGEYYRYVQAEIPANALTNEKGEVVYFDAQGNQDDEGEYCLCVKDGAFMTQDEYDLDVRNAEKLDTLSKEAYFVDIGLGNKENEDGELIESSAFNAALHGINFLGYGKDEDGDPKNIVSLVKQMAQICTLGSGKLSQEEYDELFRLVRKSEYASAELQNAHTNQTAATGKLENMSQLLEDNFYTTIEQYSGIEDVDAAEAISSFLWAQYSYNAALRVGNSVLAQSLMDYMQ